MILQHALCGDLPEWPHAGAVQLENKFSNELANIGYLAIQQFFRINVGEAYKFLFS